MRKRVFKVFVLAFLLGKTLAAQSESETTQDVQVKSTQKYTVSKIEFEGQDYYSDYQMINFTGISVGDKVSLEGNRIASAIRKLWQTGRFSDVQVYTSEFSDGTVGLKFKLSLRQQIRTVTVKGVKKSVKEELIAATDLDSKKRLTTTLEEEISDFINEKFIVKGYPDAKAKVTKTPVKGNDKQVDIVVEVDRGPRVKVDKINIRGNEVLSDAKLQKKALKKVNKKSINFLQKSSKVVQEELKEDIERIEKEYIAQGYRDAKVIGHEVIRKDSDSYVLNIDVEEGERYYIGDIEFDGNSVYDTQILKNVLGYKEGDAYNATGVQKKVSGSEKDDDIQTLYLDSGYLFSSAVVEETSLDEGNKVNLRIKLLEGPQARYDKVTFSGNTVTRDHVLVRELRTRPGDLFSKTNLKRTYFELAQLGFFNPAQIKYDLNPDPRTGTVDIDWQVAEQSSSQIELQGGYGGGRLIGTLGLSFGNFSLRKLFPLFNEDWNPIPQGDGQTLSIRAQAGQNFQNYSLSFTEPWIGGKKPTALNVSLYHTITGFENEGEADSKLKVYGASAGLTSLLSWPDDYFRLNNTLSYKFYDFSNYPLIAGDVEFENGKSHNLNYSIGLSRNSAGPDPIFPTSGSTFSASLKFTFPYSIFNNKDYSNLSVEEKNRWLEYYKFNFSGNWYESLGKKFVLRAGAEFGLLGGYNTGKIGITPFERFYLGGTGLQGATLDGRQLVPLRGYDDASTAGGSSTDVTPQGGGVLYHKYLMELRYPFVTGQSMKVYGLGFVEAGNTWGDYADYDPFNLRRSAGGGIRLFMPAFGLLGLDMGYGFDSNLGSDDPSGWQTHFIFGRSF